MNINAATLSKMLVCSAELFQNKSYILSDIDSKFGDGDHGITMEKIGNTILSSVKNWSTASIHDFLVDLGDAIMAVNGGSAGPLYGTMIGGMAEALNDESEIDSILLKKMLEAMLLELQSITTAKVGDKTMMDALIPAVLAGTSCTGDIPDILNAASTAATSGAEGTKNYIAKYGRAKSYKEQTLGTPDAGATSTALFFQGLASGV